jgi:antitoxin ChpS
MNQTFADAFLPPDDLGIERATKRAVATMRERYGDDLVGVYLFGSRARGDYQPFSDVNIAVIIEDHRLTGSRWLLFVDLGYDMLIETGAELQITVLTKSEWLDPSRSERPGHVWEIRRDATDLLTSFWEE